MPFIRSSKSGLRAGQPSKRVAISSNNKVSLFWQLVIRLLSASVLLTTVPVQAATDCTFPTPQSQIPLAQCQALVDLYNSTGGPSWMDAATNNWNVTNTPCSWRGVMCSGGNVTQIVRGSKNLVGTLPTSLNALTGLTTLYLYNSQLSGPIPTLPASLTKLDLAGNQLSGPIPTLPASLMWLDLSNNQLSGPIPTLPASLTYLYLSNNQLSGIIPDLSGTALAAPNVNLSYVNLSCNQFTGETNGSATVLDPDWATCAGATPTTFNLTLAAVGSGTVSSSGTPAGTSCGTNCFTYLNTTPITLNATPGSGFTFGSWSCTPAFVSGNSLTANTTCTATFTATTLCAAQTQIPVAECNALVDFYNSTGGPNWTDAATNNWNVTNSPCSWTGVKCSAGASGNVIAINKFASKLSGPLPASLNALTGLQTLDLSNNQLSGIIPDLSTTALAAPYVDLSCNQFTGETGTSATDRDSDWATAQCFSPTAPSGLTVTAVSPTQIDLSWTDNSSDETGFKIESPIGIALTTIGVNITIYSHIGLTCNTTYTYSVIATNANGDSSAITGSATTQACPVPLPTYTLTIRSTGKGTGTIGYQLSNIQGNALSGTIPCSDTQAGCTYGFSSGTWVKLTATPNADAKFTGWSGDTSGCSGGLLLFTQNATCTAYFDLIATYNLTVSLAGTGNGQVTSSPVGIDCGTSCSATFKEKTTVGLTAVAAKGSEFKGFSGDCVNGQVTMEQAKSCQALFDLVTPVVEQPPVTEQPTVVEPVNEPTTPVATVTPIMPQAVEISESESDMPSNEIFIVLISTKLGQIGRRLTIDQPERIFVTAKLKPYPKHVGELADIMVTYHWTPDEQTDPIIIPIRVKKQIKLLERMEMVLYRGILYDLYGTFEVNLHYQLKDGTRVGTEHAATLRINKNHPPTDILLSNNTVKRDSPQGTVIGTLSTIDEDKGEFSFLYGLVEDAGKRFMVQNNQLVVNSFRSDKGKLVTNHKVIVRSIDMIGEYIDKPFTIEVTD